MWRIRTGPNERRQEIGGVQFGDAEVAELLCVAGFVVRSEAAEVIMVGE